jgi:hypothetical protein
MILDGLDCSRMLAAAAHAGKGKREGGAWHLSHLAVLGDLPRSILPISQQFTYTIMP